MTSKSSTVVAKPAPAPHSAEDKAKLATMPSLNAAVVIEAYTGNVVGKDLDMVQLVSTLRESFDASKAGDLGGLERMLIGQATALQTIFASLARRAQLQEFQKNYESFLTLALKAQAQSRATIQAVVELKYPKQVAFVKQANISNGPQQVNNGIVATDRHVTEVADRAGKKRIQSNKLLEGQADGRAQMDIGTTTKASRSDSEMDPMVQVDRAEKCRRKAKSLQ